MKTLKDLSIADLKALLDYYTLVIKDAVNDRNTNLIIKIEPQISAVNTEISNRIKSIKF